MKRAGKLETTCFPSLTLFQEGWYNEIKVINGPFSKPGLIQSGINQPYTTYVHYQKLLYTIDDVIGI